MKDSHIVHYSVQIVSALLEGPQLDTCTPKGLPQDPTEQSVVWDKIWWVIAGLVGKTCVC